MRCKSKVPSSEVVYDPRYVHLAEIADREEECVLPEGHPGPHASKVANWSHSPREVK